MAKDKLKNILIVCGFPFPHGYSGTNRILSYSKGFVEYERNVFVLIFTRTEDKTNPINDTYKGNYNGIYYEYASKNHNKGNFKIGKIIFYCIDLIRSLKKIYLIHKQNKIDALIISTDTPGLIFLYSFFSRIIKIPRRILIVDEYPKPIRYGGTKQNFVNIGFLRLAFLKLSAVISMTHSVLNYYQKIIKWDFNSFIVPITVDNKRFSLQTKQKENIITYVGNLEIQKDGVDILIKAFNQITNNHPDFKLLLVGQGKDIKHLRKLVNELELFDRVIFKGKVKSNEIPEILCSAKILCLARPNSKRAEGGFPTKLGEYLASGTPVLITSVGEITNYLTHEVDAYIAEPDDINDFAKKLEEILNNYKDAIIIGEKGKKITETVFNYNYQSKRMLDFLESLI